MIALPYLVFPVCVSALYAAVYRKAGFHGSMLFVPLVPFAFALLEVLYVNLVVAGWVDPPVSLVSEEAQVIRPLVITVIGWIPLVVLIFAKWPLLARSPGDRL